jgi:hypothetical protein
MTLKNVLAQSVRSTVQCYRLTANALELRPFNARYPFGVPVTPDKAARSNSKRNYQDRRVFMWNENATRMIVTVGPPNGILYEALEGKRK